MTHTDPSSEAAWQEARALAAKVAKGEPTRRSEALPFMFRAGIPPAVLVHRGAVVKDKGPAVAGAYLRDLGIVRGEGPGIEDILFVLYALEAWPPVKKVHRQGYINVPDSKRLADLTAQKKHNGNSAQVILHYFLPDKSEPSEDDEGDSGEPVDRRLLRTTLDIPATGDASWRVEEISWTEPTESTSGDPWKKAEAIAAGHAGRPVKKRSDELPYFFHHASGPGAVLVHENKVVTEKGVAVAARYLSDIGIAGGAGPEIIQVLTILRYLDALPEVGSKDPTSYIPALRSSDDTDPTKELQAKVERTGGVARVVLHYWSSKPKGRGSPSRPQPRRVARAELTIGDDAAPAWKLTSLEWLPPEHRE